MHISDNGRTPFSHIAPFEEPAPRNDAQEKEKDKEEKQRK